MSVKDLHYIFTQNYFLNTFAIALVYMYKFYCNVKPCLNLWMTLSGWLVPQLLGFGPRNVQTNVVLTI